ncbi:hypothetical protein O181_080901 [Austropuccinia psidii MF-1]|uniref:Uncharacterized protein n=1 Tax=Austropuccinia psidii MF-1 TaxID=1389203 RepID=A0A9Q3FJ33_9BASI|nr:hypothetical protein [Austropuccinia psidii MF-1]
MAPYHSAGIRGQIVGMHDSGASIHTIAQHLEVPPTTVHNTIRRYQERGHLKSLPIPVDVSINTLCKAIHELGKQSCIAVKKNYLSPQHMQRLLDLARAHLHWTPVTQRRIWRSINQKYDLESMAVNHHSGHCSIMVWGALCGPIQSELILMPPGQRRAVDFIENVYEPALLPFMDELVKVGVSEDREELTLMEDRAPMHTEISSQQWQEEN